MFQLTQARGMLLFIQGVFRQLMELQETIGMTVTQKSLCIALKTQQFPLLAVPQKQV
ncbi:hypothetical protein D3C80_456120 [compost metagenome]